jgi:hypothetical protein
MGHSTILDVIGSFVTFGLLLLIVLQMNMSMSESRQTYGYNYRNQTNLTTLIMMLEDDFSRIAYSALPNDPLVTPAANAILAAESNLFRYRTDIDNNGVVDVVEYSFLDTDTIGSTENKMDRFLTKREWINGGAVIEQKWNLGVTRFSLKYLQAGTERPLNTPVADPRNVGLIQLEVQIESPEKPKQEFLGDTSQYQVFWRQVRVTSKNLAFR